MPSEAEEQNPNPNPGSETGVEETSTSSEINWDSLLAVDDSDDDSDLLESVGEESDTEEAEAEASEEGSEETTESQQAETETEQTPPPEQETPQPAEAESTETPEQPEEPQPESQEQPEQPEQRQPTEQEQQEAFQRYETELRQMYESQITDEDADEIFREPKKVLSKLAATLHSRLMMSSMQNVQEMFNNTLPQMVSSTLESQRRGQELWSKFQEKFPELTDGKYSQMLADAYNTQRQRNPNMNDDELVRNVGVQVWMQSGLDPNQLLAKVADSPSQPVEEEPEGPQGGFAPAAQSGGTPPPSQPARQQPTNPFTQLAEEFLQEDDS